MPVVRKLSDKYISNRYRAGNLTDTSYQLHTLVPNSVSSISEILDMLKCTQNLVNLLLESFPR